MSKLIELLKAHSIQLVVDVRSDPYSKFASHFNKAEIESELKRNGFDYLYLGHKLGGKPRSPGFCTPSGAPDYEKMAQSEIFLEGVAGIESIADERKLVLMCSEADPKACHRDRLLAWVFRSRGHTVNHILHDGSICEAPLMQKHQSLL
jgi:uncharacterized protein (DUF488 family)